MAAGAEYHPLHRLLQGAAQRQEAQLALPPVQGRAGHKLLQEQVSHRGQTR